MSAAYVFKDIAVTMSTSGLSRVAILLSTEVPPFQMIARNIDTRPLDIVRRSPYRLFGTELLTEKDGGATNARCIAFSTTGFYQVCAALDAWSARNNRGLYRVDATSDAF